MAVSFLPAAGDSKASAPGSQRAPSNLKFAPNTHCRIRTASLNAGDEARIDCVHYHHSRAAIVPARVPRLSGRAGLPMGKIAGWI